MPRGTPPPPTALAAVALISAAALGYEVLLTRLFAIIQWHHFAHMAIGLALLGYSASGTFLALGRGMLPASFASAFGINALLFGLTASACFLIAQALPFNPLELLWDPWQVGYLMAIGLLLALPFFFAANAIALVFQQWSRHIGRSYAADLLGAGAGSLVIVLLLWWLPPLTSLFAAATLGPVAAALVLGRRERPAALAAALVLPFLGALFTLQPSPYKALSQALEVMGAEVVARRSSPLGLVTVVASPEVPFRHAPGLSFLSPALPGEQLGVFVDGEGPGAIVRADGEPEQTAYLAHLGSALPYRLLKHPRVGVLGADGGLDVRQALILGARSVTAVELNPQILGLVRGPYHDYSGGLYRDPRVETMVADARRFLERDDLRYDLIQIPPVDSFAASTAGLGALEESYLLTVEAFQEALVRLTPGGMLAVTRWLKTPPRDSLKLFITAVDALEGSGVRSPGNNLVLIRSWNTFTLLVKSSPFTAGETASLRRFAEDHAFDTAWYPGMTRSEANRFNRWPEPTLYLGCRALLGPGRDAFIADYPYQIAPARDDRPYFFHFFRWELLARLSESGNRNAFALVDWGYPLLLATIAQVTVLGLLLVLLPLVLVKRRNGAAPPEGLRVPVYFFCLGLAFMFLEIAFIQRLILFLGHPVYAVAVALGGFLVFAGIGSRLGEPLRERWGERRSAAGAIAAAVTLGAQSLWVLPWLFTAAGNWDDGWRMALALGAIAPLALAMGLPFPLGLEAAARHNPSAIPWGWAFNGWASVTGSGLATLAAVHWGLSTVTTMALGLYLIALGMFPDRR
jgi:hypothetical protein